MAEPTREQLRAENRRLRRENEQLRRDKKHLKKRLGELETRVTDLQKALEESRRQNKRQAAPFSKGRKKAPRKPGRKPGPNYGRKARRQPPAPETIDETHEASLPESCPRCHGDIRETEVRPQYQVEIPRRPIHRQFNVHIGRCRGCGRRVQGRHHLQTSDALGAAAVQLGPHAQAALVVFNKRAGLSHGKGVALLKQLFGISLSRSGSVQVVLRAGRRLEPQYRVVQEDVRTSWEVAGDETGWRIGGAHGWLHVLATETATCYLADPSRGAEVAARVLGWDWNGILVHDGWAPYDHFTEAVHQQCARHVLCRARDRAATAVRGAVRFPRRVNALFEEAFRWRDRYRNGEITAAEMDAAGVRLSERLGEITRRAKTDPANDRLARHLRNHLWQWFLFLFVPGVAATNWRAEQAIRPAVVNRKVWGGNRTAAGARAQAVLMSVLQTCLQNGHSPLEFLSRTLCGRPPALLTSE